MLEFFILGRTNGSTPPTRGRSPVRELRTPGSVRGAPGNGRLYRDSTCQPPCLSALSSGSLMETS